jgi:IclR family KDG regulon transcriptional repressor
LLQHSPATGKYSLGHGVLRYSRAFLQNLNITREVRPTLEFLNKELDETVHLGLLDDNSHNVIYVDKLDSSKKVRMVSYIGGVIPVHCTALGKAMLSVYKDEVVRTLLANYEFKQITEKTIKNMEEFLAELAQIRQRGYATDLQENDNHVICVGAPILNTLGTAKLAISVSAPADRLDEEHIEYVGGKIMDAAKEISQRLSNVPLDEDTKYKIIGSRY